MADINEFAKLLEEFGKLEIKERTSTLLEIAQCPHFENVWSNILAFYLNPQKEHGLGDFLLKSLFQAIGKEVDLGDLEKIKVGREYSTGTEKRIDIVITGSNFVAGIENKVNAPLYNDLKDYADTLDNLAKQSGSRAYKIVLSKYGGNNPSDGFEDLSYVKLVKTLKQNIGNYMTFSDTKYFIFFKDFLTTVENNLNNNIMEDNPKLRHLIANNFGAINTLAQYRGQLWGACYNKFRSLEGPVKEKMKEQFAAGLIRCGYWDEPDDNGDLLLEFSFKKAPSLRFYIQLKNTEYLSIEAEEEGANNEVIKKIIEENDYRLLDRTTEEIADDIVFRLNQILKLLG
ncbi:MAG: PD-(D/E)XK nuclease family protein [Prevotellaceae bacterium]|jgi:hypothetical protein|nr:PD-(D/E)XK nuclease family protein [Prevotellaceae bacterium]